MLKELLLAMFLIFSNLVRKQFIVIFFVLNIMLIKVDFYFIIDFCILGNHKSNQNTAYTHRDYSQQPLIPPINLMLKLGSAISPA